MFEFDLRLLKSRSTCHHPSQPSSPVYLTTELHCSIASAWCSHRIVPVVHVELHHPAARRPDGAVHISDGSGEREVLKIDATLNVLK
jgi:hypothetical protein